MVIHEDVPGIMTVIRCNGKTLKELDHPHADTISEDEENNCPTIAKYIESVDNAEFDVVVSVNELYVWTGHNHCLVARVSIDGHSINSRIINRKNATAEAVISGTEEYCNRRHKWFLRRSKFRAVTTIELAPHERIERDKEIAKTAGQIEITFERKLQLGLIKSHGDNKTTEALDLELAKKALNGKALSHSTTFGKKEPVELDAYHTVPIKDGDEPILKVIFYYRSREGLKTELVIPRSPSPTFANLTREERDRLARERLEQLRDVKIKREGSVVIKREYGETVDLTDENFTTIRPAKRSCLRIDLTDDD